MTGLFRYCLLVSGQIAPVSILGLVSDVSGSLLSRPCVYFSEILLDVLEVVYDLNHRWVETDLNPSLSRIDV